MSKKVQKTNAMRMLDFAKIQYEVLEYKVDENDLSGVHIAKQLNESVECVFKTLVARGEKGEIKVFCIPVAQELDLKKCAKVSGDKKIEMIAVKELLGITGYIRGGCSPIGMKKQFQTFIDETAELFSDIYISGGKRGTQIKIYPYTLKDFVNANFADLIK